MSKRSVEKLMKRRAGKKNAGNGSVRVRGNGRSLGLASVSGAVLFVLLGRCVWARSAFIS